MSEVRDALQRMGRSLRARQGLPIVDIIDHADLQPPRMRPNPRIEIEPKSINYMTTAGHDGDGRYKKWSLPPVDPSQGWPTPTCRAIRQGDEVYCPTCAIRWSLSDDRPECPK